MVVLLFVLFIYVHSLIPAQHRILWVNCVDLVWNAILASQAQRKESVFQELDGFEEDTIPFTNVTAFGEPLVGASHMPSNDTAATIVIIDDVSEDASGQFNSTSSSSSKKALAV